MVTRTYQKILLLVMYKLLYKSLSCYQKNKKNWQHLFFLCFKIFNSDPKSRFLNNEYWLTRLLAKLYKCLNPCSRKTTLKRPNSLYHIPCKGRIVIPKSSSSAKAAIKLYSSCRAADRSSVRFKQSLARSMALSVRSAEESKYSLEASKTSSMPLEHLIRGPATGSVGSG